MGFTHSLKLSDRTGCSLRELRCPRASHTSLDCSSTSSYDASVQHLPRGVDPSSLRALPQLFRPPFLRRLVSGQHRKHLGEALEAVGIPRGEVETIPVGDVLELLYQGLTGFYRCEYVFKNAVAQSLFLLRHDPSSAFLTDEFRSGESRADVVILNGTSTVYEIKTELDSFSKLGRQIADYSQIFDRINLVVPPAFASKALLSAPERVGVLVIEGDLRISETRTAVSNKANTSNSHIFDCMRMIEYQACLKEALGVAPDVPNSMRYKVYRELFLSLAPELAHDLMVKHVRKRSKNPAIEVLLRRAPACLAHSCLTLGESRQFAEKLALALETPVGVL